MRFLAALGMTNKRYRLFCHSEHFITHRGISLCHSEQREESLPLYYCHSAAPPPSLVPRDTSPEWGRRSRYTYFLVAYLIRRREVGTPVTTSLPPYGGSGALAPIWVSIKEIPRLRLGIACGCCVGQTNFYGNNRLSFRAFYTHRGISLLPPSPKSTIQKRGFVQASFSIILFRSRLAFPPRACSFCRG